MKNSENIKTCGKIIKEAREAKGLTRMEIVYEINSSKVTEKTVKHWEEDKDFPNLEMIYKLAYILEINPTDLLIFRDKTRKRFLRNTDKIKDRKFNKDEFTENAYYIFQAFCRCFIIFVVAISAHMAVSFSQRLYNDSGVVYERTIENAIDEGTNTITRIDNEKNNIVDNTSNEINVDI